MLLVVTSNFYKKLQALSSNFCYNIQHEISLLHGHLLLGVLLGMTNTWANFY